MPVVGFRCIKSNKNVSFEECMACALTYENKCHFTADILKGIITEVTETRESISITKLIGCPRSTYLVNRNDVYVSPEKLYWAFRGTLAHAIIEKYMADPDAVVEKHFKRVLNGIKITGKPDIIIPKHELMRDYKTTKEVPFFNKVYLNHEIQLNLYRWLVRKEYKVERLEVVYMDMKRSKVIPVKNIWKLSDCEDYIKKHSSVLAEAYEKNIPPDVPGEFPLYWQCRDFCEGRTICAKLYQEEIRKDFDKWAETEWCDAE